MIYQNGELFLTGAVGDYPGEDHFTSSDVRYALTLHKSGPLTVMLNSGGGYVADGLAIHNALKATPGKVTVVIDGIAASAGSLIAMAGDTIIMRRGGLMMLHDPAGHSTGTAADHEKARNGLDAMAQEMAEIYAERSGKTVAEVRTLMVAETWFNGTEAVAAGFVDMVDDMRATAVARFAYATAYRHAPDAIQKPDPRAVLAHAVASANRRVTRQSALQTNAARPPRSESLRTVMAQVKSHRKRVK